MPVASRAARSSGALTGADIVVSARRRKTMDDDELLAELEGAAGSPTSPNSAMSAPAPRNAQPRKSPAGRSAEDFEKFKPLFQQVQQEIETGIRTTRHVVKDSSFLKAEIKAGQFVHRWRTERLCRRDGRRSSKRRKANRRPVAGDFHNGTESNLLMRSLQRALYKDEGGPTHHRSGRRTAVCRTKRGRRRSGQRHDLRAAKQVRPPDRRRQSRPSS